MTHLSRLAIGVVLGLWCWAIAVPGAYAQSAESSYQSNQSMSIATSLVAPEPDMEISIYPQPNTRKPRIGYGVNGDAVTVVEQTGSNGGTTWNRIQFDGVPDAEGWVQLEFLSIAPDMSSAQSHQPDQPKGYMGRQTLPQQSGAQPSYSQQAQRRNYR